MLETRSICFSPSAGMVTRGEQVSQAGASLQNHKMRVILLNMKKGSDFLTSCSWDFNLPH